MIATAHRSIQTALPAPGTEEILARLAKVEPRSMHGQVPLVWGDAFDYQIDDPSGNRFIDFTSGIFVANVGHANLNVWRAIDEALNTPLHSYTFATESKLKYLEALTKWSGFDKAFLACSGTEATETALRLMRSYGAQRKKRAGGVVCFSGNFHGRTMGAHFMSGKNIPSAFDMNIHHIDFPYWWGCKSFSETMESLKHLDFDQDLCGFMLETYQGWCAAFYPVEFVQELAAFCREHHLLLCFDEMQAGFARTGRKFGYEWYDVKPDLICVGKAMGGGFPLSGVLGRAEVMDAPAAGEMSSTHGGNPLACIAGLATLKEIDRLNLVSEASRKGTLMMDWWLKLQPKLPKRILSSGRGLIRGLIIGEEWEASQAKRIVERCYQNGLLLINTGRPSIKIGPPLTIPDDALREGLEILGEAILEVMT